jgi:two-component system chemotaxis response regulator CheB
LASHDIVVIGASAGGVEVLCELARGLPPGLPAAVFVVCHFPPAARSALPEILSRQGPLLAVHPRDREPVYPGHIYIAPPDYHMTVEDSVVRVQRGPRENRFRPAIDPLFRSAARVYNSRVIGVLLSGALTDGVAGLLAVRSAGGKAVLQEPADAALSGLPRAARDIAGADHIVPGRALAPLLVKLIGKTGGGEGEGAMTDPIDPVESMNGAVDRDMTAQTREGRRGQISVFSCPECGGCMWQVDEEQLLRFRCHVGHVYLGEALFEEQSAALEAALWTAVRTFREKSVLATQIAARQREKGNVAAAARFEEDARQAEQYGGLIHQYLLQGAPHPPAEPGGGRSGEPRRTEDSAARLAAPTPPDSGGKPS